MNNSLEKIPPENYFQKTSQALNIFHHPAWHKTISDSYGFELYYIINKDKNREFPNFVIPIMEINSKKWVSLPFTDYIVPIHNSSTSFLSITKNLHQIRKTIGAERIIIRWPMKSNENVFLSKKFYKHITPLSSDSQLLFNNFHKTRVQQCIQKAERDGVFTKFGKSWGDVKLFYNLHLRNRRRLGIPIQPLAYFKNLWKNIINENLGFVLLTYQGNQILSGAIILHWKETVTYKYSASDSRFWGLKPNNLMLWEAIKWGCDNGYKKFDWGRTDINNEGLRNFKAGWGSKEEILHYTILSDDPPKISRQKSISKLMEPIIQNSPLWVCRVIGEMIYRFAA